MKRAFLAVLGIILVVGLWSENPERFVNGAYTPFMMRLTEPQGTTFSELATQLQNLGYNTARYSMSDDETQNGALQAALNELSSKGIYSILSDWTVKNSAPAGVTMMANCNHMKMEAEYILEYRNGKFTPDVLPQDDSANDAFNYVFRHDTGSRSDYDIKKYSNGYAWICTEAKGDKPGTALTEPRFRWKPNDRNISRTICYDLRFSPYFRNNRLYVVVALNWSGLEPGDKVADIAFKVLKNSSLDSRVNEFGVYPEDAYYTFELKSLYPALYGTTILNQEYPEVKRDSNTGFTLFEYYIEIPHPGTQLFIDLMRSDFFNHVNPQVYWHGKGELALDYLVLEDEHYRALTSESANNPIKERFLSHLDNIEKLDNSSSLIYYYAKDEPFQGQFAVYSQLERILNTKGKKPITAIHLEGTKLTKPGGLNDYFHAGQFLKSAKPGVLMLDAYPLQEWGAGSGSLIRWNEESKHPNFIQNKLESILLANYYKLTSAINRDAELAETELFFVPQIFGEKYDPVESGEWRFFMPPRNMLKCLKLMPLCYAADGIMDFEVTVDRNTRFPQGSRNYIRISPLSNGPTNTDIKPVPGEAYCQKLTEANDLVNCYGPILKQMIWVDADSIMVNGEHPKINMAKFNLNELQVVSSGKGPYEGYVQCGWYLDKHNMPSFMLVNRRAVYKLKDSPDVVPLDVDNHFTDAEPQTLRFVLDKKSAGIYALYDPYTKKLYTGEKGRIEIILGAGEGILLQMVPLPLQIKGMTNDTDGRSKLQGKITIEPRKVLLLTAEQALSIEPNTTILISKNATLDIRGETSFGSGVRIILEPGAKLKLAPGKANLASDTLIESQKRPNWLQRLFGKS